MHIHRWAATTIVIAFAIWAQPQPLQAQTASSTHVHKNHGDESAPRTPFAIENDAAMSKMMAAMELKYTGDVDRDFVEMMIPHHQGAIDMAKAYLRFGKNDRLRRMAQEIIVEQLGEIAAMRMALGDPIPPSSPVPTQIGTVPPQP